MSGPYGTLTRADQLRAQKRGKWNEPSTLTCGNAVIIHPDDFGAGGDLDQWRMLVGTRADPTSHAKGIRQIIHGGYTNPVVDWTPQVTAVREVGQEVGLTLTDVQFIGVVGPWIPRSTARKGKIRTEDGWMNTGPTAITYNLFGGTVRNPEIIQESEETTHLSWMSLTELYEEEGDNADFRSWLVVYAAIIVCYDCGPAAMWDFKHGEDYSLI